MSYLSPSSEVDFFQVSLSPEEKGKAVCPWTGSMTHYVNQTPLQKGIKRFVSQKAVHNDSSAFHFIFMAVLLWSVYQPMRRNMGSLAWNHTQTSNLSEALAEHRLAHQCMPCKNKYINKLFVIWGLGARVFIWTIKKG